MTYDAREALSVCRSDDWKIIYEIRNLKLLSLKAFVQGIEDDARSNLQPIELGDTPRGHRSHISDFCLSV